MFDSITSQKDVGRRLLIAEPVGYKVIGTVRNIKREYNFGYKVEDKFKLSGYSASGT